MLLGTFMLYSLNIDLNSVFGLHHWASDKFEPYQFVTYMFMHGNMMHLFFNMFALWMFGRVLEQVWGSKRFLIYYMITGIGAGVLQIIVMSFELTSVYSALEMIKTGDGINAFASFIEDYIPGRSDLYLYAQEILIGWSKNPSATDYQAEALNIAQGVYDAKRNVGTVGASGSVFGLLLAFGVLFPNTELLLIFPPIPIKAKYFVFGYGFIELYMGISSNPGDNVAHFAHLGGMLFGYILIRYWRKTTNTLY